MGFSLGCDTCRARKVRCDQTKPKCKTCLRRGTPCGGYRDVNGTLFKDQSDTIARKSKGLGPKFEQDLIRPKSSHSPRTMRFVNAEKVSRKSSGQPDAYNLLNHSSDEEDEALNTFFGGFVMYPCSESSSSGFLEYLPCLFEEVKSEQRDALRWAVRAVAYGNLANERNDYTLAVKAQKCYGMALAELRRSLSDRTASTSDYTLMTVVVLDLFELIYVGEDISPGSHTDGMAQILRLRGHSHIYDTRGWSLFRLAHHRLQQKQLAFKQEPLVEAEAWMESLDVTNADEHTLKDVSKVNRICQRAREVRTKIIDTQSYSKEAFELIKEMHALDYVASTWRAGQNWAYTTVYVSGLKTDQEMYPGFVQLHHDAWIAYEWNYHRTARIILHEHLIECIDRLVESADFFERSKIEEQLVPLKQASTEMIQTLGDEILSTVAQSFGDIDSEGRILDTSGMSVPCRGVAGYFLLWPIKILKSNPSVTDRQRREGANVFERIREFTGMKQALGSDSSI